MSCLFNCAKENIYTCSHALYRLSSLVCFLCFVNFLFVHRSMRCEHCGYRTKKEELLQRHVAAKHYQLKNCAKNLMSSSEEEKLDENLSKISSALTCKSDNLILPEPVSTAPKANLSSSNTENVTESVLLDNVTYKKCNTITADCDISPDTVSLVMPIYEKENVHDSTGANESQEQNQEQNPEQKLFQDTEASHVDLMETDSNENQSEIQTNLCDVPLLKDNSLLQESDLSRIPLVKWMSILKTDHSKLTYLLKKQKTSLIEINDYSKEDFENKTTLQELADSSSIVESNQVKTINIVPVKSAEQHTPNKSNERLKSLQVANNDIKKKTFSLMSNQRTESDQTVKKELLSTCNIDKAPIMPPYIDVKLERMVEKKSTSEMDKSSSDLNQSPCLLEDFFEIALLDLQLTKTPTDEKPSLQSKGLMLAVQQASSESSQNNTIKGISNEKVPNSVDSVIKRSNNCDPIIQVPSNEGQTKWEEKTVISAIVKNSLTANEVKKKLSTNEDSKLLGNCQIKLIDLKNTRSIKIEQNSNISNFKSVFATKSLPVKADEQPNRLLKDQRKRKSIESHQEDLNKNINNTDKKVRIIELKDCSPSKLLAVIGKAILFEA